jgi:uncharacterized membrane protein YhiD involved in acid resistance
MMSTPLNIETAEMVWRMGGAALLGAVVGLEREFTQKSAGLRTHMLVSLGAATFTVLSLADWAHFSFQQAEATLPAVGAHLNLSRDPTRIAAQIVTGIGFIGGGAVLREGSSVRGVTTAASLWTTAAIGMLSGLGLTHLAVFASLLTVGTLYVLGKLERLIFQKHVQEQDRLLIEVQTKPESTDTVRTLVEEAFKGQILSFESRHGLPLSHWLEGASGAEGSVPPTHTGGHLHTPVISTYVIDVSTREPFKELAWARWRRRLEEQEGVISLRLDFYSDEA